MDVERSCESGDRKRFRLHRVLCFAALVAVLATGVAHAQVPADIEAKLLKIGPIVDPGCTAKIYRPLMPPEEVADQYLEMEKTGKPSNQVPLYPGITIERDVSFGRDPNDVVDIFHAENGPASRTVLIYVAGGPGTKIEIQNKQANAFNDNIARWATENGMVGVLMQRHGPAPGAPPDFYAPARDVSAMLRWVEANISKYQGNPNRIFIWAHSAANGPVGIYAGHPELYGPKGIGLKGIVFMSGQFNILRPDGSNPVPPAAPARKDSVHVMGAACGEGPSTANSGALPGKAPGQPGGPVVMPEGTGGRGHAPKVSRAELIKRSSLPGLEKTSAKIFLASAEFDPGVVDGKPSSFNRALHDELCKLDGAKAVDGKGHCPMLVVMKGESHMSEPFSVDSGDRTVSAPILAWIRSVQ
ncbi:MAG TPA: hypothetical protein VNI36_01705 [Candidatus Dormibacteraeota bacterium]|nr:hypothetical protein [Candidatus Dormibacteraeota bacterium]